jgi:hypothetical protein
MQLTALQFQRKHWFVRERRKSPQLMRGLLGRPVNIRVKPMKMGLWCCGLMAVAGPVAAQDSLIPAAKGVSLSSLDSTLPALPLARWLSTLRPGAAIEWEVNDCGEGGDGRQAPTCVEAMLRLGADSTAHASLIVAGIDGKSSEPAVWNLAVAVGSLFTHYRTLQDWAAHIRSQHR